MRNSLTGAIGATILTLCATTAFAVAAPSSQDKMFVTKAAQGGLAEVADAKLALSKDATPKVKTIAQQMQHDHSMANAKLASIAQSEGLMVPAAPDSMDAAQMAKQKPLSGSAFSAAYLRDQKAAHVKTIALFKQEIASGSDPKIVAFAKMTLPTIEGHLTMIDSAIVPM